MSRRDLDELELGRRVGRYLVIENEMSVGVRCVAIAFRSEISAVVAGLASKGSNCDE